MIHRRWQYFGYRYKGWLWLWLHLLHSLNWLQVYSTDWCLFSSYYFLLAVWFLSSRFLKPKDELYNFITLQYLLLWEQMCHHPQSLAELFSFTLISLHFSMYRNLSCTRVTCFYFCGKVMTTNVGIFCNVVFLPRNQSFMMSNTSRYTM